MDASGAEVTPVGRGADPGIQTACLPLGTWPLPTGPGSFPSDLNLNVTVDAISLTSLGDTPLLSLFSLVTIVTKIKTHPALSGQQARKCHGVWDAHPFLENTQRESCEMHPHPRDLEGVPTPMTKLQCLWNLRLSLKIPSPIAFSSRPVGALP